MCSSAVERPLRMRKVQGSNPCSSSHFFFFVFWQVFFFFCSQLFPKSKKDFSACVFLTDIQVSLKLFPKSEKDFSARARFVELFVVGSD